MAVSYTDGEIDELVRERKAFAVGLGSSHAPESEARP